MTNPERTVKLYTREGLESAFKRGSPMTNVDKERGNITVGYELSLETPDLLYYSIFKKDKSTTLKLVERTGVGTDSWFILTPTDPQAQSLTRDFPSIYTKINSDNVIRRIPI